MTNKWSFVPFEENTHFFQLNAMGSNQMVRQPTKAEKVFVAADNRPVYLKLYQSETAIAISVYSACDSFQESITQSTTIFVYFNL